MSGKDDLGGSWALWIRQVRAILAMELFRSFVGFRALRVYILAALPVLLVLLAYLVPPADIELDDSVGFSMGYAGIYELFILRFIIFLGCVAIFTDLFRGEMTERSLHYYFMTPVRREVLAAGKYLSGLVGASLVFGATTAVSFLLLLLRLGPAQAGQYLFDGPGMAHLLGYLGVTVLGCVGYGAVFLGIGLVIKNPIIPAILIFGWEWINFILPSLLKKISVIHYLRSLLPVALDEGPFAVIAEPTSAWISIPGFIIFSGIVLALCGLKIRRMEIRYETD